MSLADAALPATARQAAKVFGKETAREHAIPQDMQALWWMWTAKRKNADTIITANAAQVISVFPGARHVPAKRQNVQVLPVNK